MYTKQPKKMLIVHILDILNKHSDENHRLSQKDIVDLLNREYEMKADRKTVRRNLDNLLDFGYDIEYSEIMRKDSKGEEQSILTDWYIVHKFTDGELRLIIDSLLFAKSIPDGQKKKLLSKIQDLSSKYFSRKVGHIKCLYEPSPFKSEILFTVEILCEAIEKGKQVKFLYNDIGLDFKYHPRKRSDGRVREYIINPYEMVANNGKYYLICNYDKYNELANYRVDRISGIQILDTPRKPVTALSENGESLDLSKYMEQHFVMNYGESGEVKFRMKRDLVGDVVDWFGKNLKFSNITIDEVTVGVNVNLKSMRKWALQYGTEIKVLSPQTLVEQLKEDIEIIRAKYE